MVNVLPNLNENSQISKLKYKQIVNKVFQSRTFTFQQATPNLLWQKPSFITIYKLI